MQNAECRMQNEFTIHSAFCIKKHRPQWSVFFISVLRNVSRRLREHDM